MIYDILVVGAGLSGAVIAERFANAGKKVCVIDKRNHIGGNCYDEINENGIRINKYGAHIFHTNYEDVWNYVNKFSKWKRYDHKVLSRVDGKLVPVPVNINTVNKIMNCNISNEEEMNEWLSKNQVNINKIETSEDVGRSRFGDILYEKMFKYYTKKQWDKYPNELDASVLGRISIRPNFDDRYFSDKYQALPENGYTEFISNILKHKNIEILNNTDYFEIKDKIKADIIIYTGPIDKYFEGLSYPKLEYRSINFEIVTIKNCNYYQSNSVINLPQFEKGLEDVTRIVEYKYFYENNSPHTTIVYERTTDEGEPYYPVPNKKNIELYELYKKETEKIKNVHFLGRLANYKYFMF